MSLAVQYTPEPLFSRRAYKRHMSRTAKAFSAISLGAAFALTSGEAFAQSARASGENSFLPLDGQPLGFNEAGDLRVLLASGEEITIPRGEYGLVGDQIMVSDMIDGVEVAQNGYIPPTGEDGYPVYGNTGGPFGNLGMSSVLIPLGLILGGILAYYLVQRANNKAPEFEEASYSANFEENDTGTVDTVKAVDAEGDTVTYSLSGTDAEFFSIDSSGKITFTDEPNFDAPGDEGRNNSYNFNAVATDEHGEASTVPVTITVTSEPDTPDVDATADLDSNLSSGNDDVTASGTITGFDAGNGNDAIEITGTMASGTGDMGSGNDRLTISNDLAGTPTLDLGTGNDEIVLDSDQTSAFTIDVGTGENIIDIDTATDGSVKHVVQAFGSDDILDLRGLNLSEELDTTVHANQAAALAELDDYDVVFYTDGDNIEVIIDVDEDDEVVADTDDMLLTFEDLSALTSSMVDL